MKPQVKPTPIPGVLVLELECFQDQRGFFMETWNRRDFAAAGLAVDFVQENHSRSRRGTLRGLHFQGPPAPLAKLVRCTLGAVFDVAVDLRAGSPTCGRWFAVELTADNRRQMLVPAGCAHGFAVLSDWAEIQYRQDGYYLPAAEVSLAWNDPDLAIPWPVRDPLLSGRDAAGLSLRQYLQNPAFHYHPEGSDHAAG